MLVQAFRPTEHRQLMAICQQRLAQRGADQTRASCDQNISCLPARPETRSVSLERRIRSMSETVESLKSVLWEGAPWVVLTGAGISKASGIPTYRDHQGKWLGSNPIQHDEFIQDEAKRRRYWSRSALGWPRVARALPNATHHSLSTLETAGIVSGIITQNVDRLHQASGTASVIDLHGRLDRARCLECGQYESRVAIQERLERLNDLPDLSDTALRPTVMRIYRDIY